MKPILILLGVAGAIAIGDAAIASAYRGTPATDGSPYVFLVGETGTYQRASDTAPKTITPPKCGYQRIKLKPGDASFKLNGVDTAIASLPQADFQCKTIAGQEVRFKSGDLSAVQEGFTILPNDKKAIILKAASAGNKENIWLEDMKAYEKTGTADACGVYKFLVPQNTLVDGSKINASIYSYSLNGTSNNFGGVNTLSEKPTCSGTPTLTGVNEYVDPTTGRKTYYFAGLAPNSSVNLKVTGHLFIKPKAAACGLTLIRESKSRILANDSLAIIGSQSGRSVDISPAGSVPPAYCAKVSGVSKLFVKD